MSLTAGFVSIVNQNLQHNKTSETSTKILETFSLAKALPMRVESYVDHFLYQLDLEEKLLSSTFLILEHFFEYLSSNNLHKLVFTALVLSYKAYTDKPAKNSTLEKIGILKNGELFELEKKMLEFIDWRFSYSRTEEVCEKLIEEGKVEEITVEDYNSLEDHETDFTECDDSFSELSVFF
jgi:hypothetical protein